MSLAIADRPGAGVSWSPALVLFAALSALPWLLPVHAEPWPSFHAEAVGAAAALVAAVWLLAADGGAWPWGRVETGLLALAGVPLAQALAGMLVYPGEGMLVAACLAGTALAVLVGRRAQTEHPDALLEALFASLALAALISAGLAAYQWLALDSLDLLVQPMGSDGRPCANVGQPNNLSTLLAWGLVGVQWAHASGRVRAPLALACAVVVLFGVALTQSRTGWLQVAFIAAAALRWRAGLGARRSWLVVLALAAVFAAFVLALVPLGHAISREVPLDLGRQVETGKRPLIWQLALQAIGSRPLLGYGWNQTILAHVALADRFADLHVAVGHAHNVVLDLLLWNGVPIGAAVGVGAVLWWRAQAKAPRRPSQALAITAVGVVTLHALLELPHAYLFFLLPTGLMVGALSAGVGTPARARCPRAVVGLLLLALGAWTVAAWRDYVQIEDSLRSWRLRESNIARAVPPVEPRPVVLGYLQQALEEQRTRPSRGMSQPELDRMRAIASRYPNVGQLFRYAKASALNGRPEDAAWAVLRLCALHKVDDCRAARRDWCAAARSESALRAVAWPRTEAAERRDPAIQSGGIDECPGD